MTSMSILTVEEFWESDGEVGSSNQRNYTRRYKITTDSVSDEAETVFRDVRLPRRFDPYPLNGASLANRIRARRSESPLLWSVDVEYETPSAGSQEQDPDPLARPSEVSMDVAIFQRPAILDIDGNPILNSAKDPFADPIAEQDDVRPTLTITRNEPTLNTARNLQYTNAVNADAFFGFDPGEVKCMQIRQDRQVEQDQDDPSRQIEFWRTTFEFHMRPNTSLRINGVLTPVKGWDLALVDMGYYELRAGLEPGDPARRMAIRDAAGGQVSHPVRLDGNGKPLDWDAPFSDTEYRKFSVYKELAYAPLGLP